jgi:glucose/arabinose dehydrogenase
MHANSPWQFPDHCQQPPTSLLFLFPDPGLRQRQELKILPGTSTFLRVSLIVLLLMSLFSLRGPNKSRAQSCTPTPPVAPVAAPGYVVSDFADCTNIPDFGGLLSGPTCMTFDSQGNLYVGTLGGEILVLTENDNNGNGVVDLGTVQQFATVPEPLGLDFRSNGDLFVTSNPITSGTGAQFGQVLRLRDTDGDGVADDTAVIVTNLPSQGLNKTDKLKFGPDGLLYFGQGSATDDGPASAEGTYNAAILTVDVDSPELPTQTPTIFATGIRNPFGMEFDPVSHALFATAVGHGAICQQGCPPVDTSPPEGIDWVVQAGKYGFPGCEGMPVASNPACAGVTAPIAFFNQHTTPTSITFYGGPQANSTGAQNQMLVSFLQRFESQGGDLERFVLSGNTTNGFTMTPVLPVLCSLTPIDPDDGPVDVAIDPISGDIYMARLDVVPHANPDEHHNIIYRIHLAGSDSLPFIGPVQPGSLNSGTGQATITMLGRHLQPGVVVLANGSPLQTSQSGAFGLTAILPASLTASAGTINITAQNPDGSVSNVEQVTVITPPPPPPVLNSLTVLKKNGHVVAQVTVASSWKKLRLVANGTAFDSGAQLLVNGSPLTLISSSATQLSAAFTKAMISTSGTLTIQVRNSSGETSGQLTLSIAP